MSIDSARALAAKVLTDEVLEKQIKDTNSEAEFDAVITKWGYHCSVSEFVAAFKEAQAKQPISDEELDQAAGGISLVGIDYPFVMTPIVP
jgi:predicted ribosomally synthesized peptide with nif11-like leader